MDKMVRRTGGGAGTVGILVLLFFLLAAGCSHVGTPPPSSKASEAFSVTIAHLNDTHSHLEPSAVTVKGEGGKKSLLLGGFPRIATLLRSLRQQGATLFVHAGDAFQGTLYFTKYQGRADWEMLNLLMPDAMTLGNHEFDKGPALVRQLVDNARFPLVAANIDAADEPLLAGKLLPYGIIQVRGEKIGIIGLSLADAASISNPGPRLRFADPIEAARRYVPLLLAQGINKIVLLSHNGYDVDLEIARAVPGVDVVVGGHSHTLLGGPDLAARGLSPEGPYPAVVKGADGKTVLVVTAWEWGKMLGILDVTFDGNGDVVSHRGRPVLVEQEVAEDPAVRAKLDEFRTGVRELEEQVVAKAADDLPRFKGHAPILGRLVAASMLWKARAVDPTVTIALQNAGGVRADIRRGPVSVGSVKSVLPFDNTLVVIDLLGSELIAALEASVAAAGADKIRAPLIGAGVRYRPGRGPADPLVSEVQVESAPNVWLPVQPLATYRIVTNSYLAGGGDYSTALKAARGYRKDLAISDADAFMDYAVYLKELRQPDLPADLSLLQEGVAGKLSLRFPLPTFPPPAGYLTGAYFVG